MLLFLHVGGDTKLIINDESFGPVSWPRVMLFGVIGTGLLWAASRLFQFTRRDMDIQQPGHIYHNNLKLMTGVLAVTLYGVAIVYTGFAVATFLFLMAWFILGGIRSPLLILGNSLLGTVVLLYLFLKVSYLPLPRGIGFMDTLTVSLYRFLGIF